MPPCLEPYTWIVMEEPITMYKDYLDIIRREGNPSGYRCPPFKWKDCII